MPSQNLGESTPANSVPSTEHEKKANSAHSVKRKKQRLDLLLVERELAESREQARRLIMAGEVLVGTEKIDKPGHPTLADAEIVVRSQPQYVSRGGLKLAAALQQFSLGLEGRVAVDVGASTGGFTDCLLQHGIAHVYAIDVGYGQLAWKIRNDPRVTPIERTNIRYLEALPDGVLADLAVIDASFISLKLVLPATMRLLKPTGECIALIKPQFEAGQDRVGKGGVVRETTVHRAVLVAMVNFALEFGLQVKGLTVSPAPGPAGNIEFLLWLGRIAEANAASDPAMYEQLIDKALQAAARLNPHKG
ncbi:MAG: TlyA family RNA methyltransferase [Caldilineaceae bacterium]